jgi:hypothetical protein
MMVSTVEGNEGDMKAAAQSAQLKEDLLNTVIHDPNANFAEECEMAYKDSFFRFGMIEVGYSADWITNPNAPKPLLGKDTDTQTTLQKRRRIIDEPAEIPQNERVYFKHIPAISFRIGGQDHKYLNRCGWCGYYEYVDKDELLSLPKLMNKDKIESARGLTPDPDRETVKLDTIRYKQNSLKIWKLWDLKSKNQLIVLDGPCVTVWQKKYVYLNLFDLRPDTRLVTNGFYPIPAAYHWISPQDEYNEIREQLRAHRRRFIRKFQVIEGTIDDEELEKFETGPDGALIKVKREGAITPVENADLGQALQESLATSTDDLNRVSGTSDESRGVADRTTATQANIVNQRTGVRESKERDRIVKWIANIGRAAITIIREKFTGKTVIQLTAPEGEHFLGMINPSAATWKTITAEDLKDGYDYKITVDVTSMSSVAAQLEKQKLLEFLSTLTQFPMVAFSPYLVREIAYRIGYRNEKAIAEFQNMALLAELARMAQLKAAVNPQPQPQNGPAGQQIAGQITPPQGEQIRNQLANQLPVAAGGPQG